MRKQFHTGILAALLASSISVGGCVVSDDDRRVQPNRLHAAPATPRKRIAKPVAAVVPGRSVKQFCADRHIRFQAGTMSEQPAEIAHNNELCRQIYETGATAEPAIARSAQ